MNIWFNFFIAAAIHHLIIGDYEGAYQEADTLKMRLTALSHMGKEQDLYREWKEGGAPIEDDLLEQMAWGVMRNGEKAPSPITRSYALLGAFAGNTDESVKMFVRLMDDQSAVVRMLAAELAGRWRDPVLMEKITELLASERDPEVRLRAIQSCGKMRNKLAEISLRELIQHPARPIKERMEAALALVLVTEDAQHADRLMLSQAVALFGEPSDVEKLTALFDDPIPDIQIAALLACHRLGVKDVPECRSLSPEVQVMRTYVTGGDLTPFLNHPRARVRAFAAACNPTWTLSDDPYVNVNQALKNLFGRKNLDQVSRVLSNLPKEKLQWEEIGGVRFVTRSRQRGRPDIPSFPLVIDQLARLEIIYRLSFIDQDRAQQMMKDYLKERAPGLTGLVTALFLQEQQEQALPDLKPLLEDKNTSVRVHTAIILANWGKDPSALHTLVTEYEKAPRRLQETILEALGNLGMRDALPFLVERFNNPYQHLRVIAASSVMKILQS